TLGSVLVVYGARLARVLAGAARGEPEARRYLGLLVLGTVPAGVAGVLFHRAVEARFHALAFVGAAFLATGAALWSTRRLAPRRPTPGAWGALGFALALDGERGPVGGRHAGGGGGVQFSPRDPRDRGRRAARGAPHGGGPRRRGRSRARRELRGGVPERDLVDPVPRGPARPRPLLRLRALLLGGRRGGP